MADYLTNYMERAHVLTNLEEIRSHIKESFDSEWKMGSLFGWEQIIKKINGSESDPTTSTENSNETYCNVCNK